ncbi:MAG: glycosyltransferase [Acidimicrobiales bacterium]|jgi:hypothetical protein|nr:glycosyltransferase [Acidimicrobiales bacterium]
MVVSHKECWRSPDSATGWATDGGFALQMAALAPLFEELRVCVPEVPRRAVGEVAFLPPILIDPLPTLEGDGWRRRVATVAWLARALPQIDRAVRRADLVHAPIPGDVGSLGMALAVAHRRPLFVRHCGNWFVRRTRAEQAWPWFMAWRAGRGDVMLATGGADAPPHPDHPGIAWIFSSSLTGAELAAVPERTSAPTGGAVRLAIACRQDERKGTGIAIRALAELRRELDGVTLDVLGSGPDLEAFRALADELGVAGAVTFHGQVGHGDVLAVLRAADLFVFPTRASEGFPKAVLEALACGLPVVTTPVSVLPTLLRDGGGIVVPEADPNLVADAVRALAMDADRYLAASQQAREIASRYTLEAWRDEIGCRLHDAYGPLGGPADPGPSR